MGRRGETGGREYLSESLTDYLYTYVLTSVYVCVCARACVIIWGGFVFVLYVT